MSMVQEKPRILLVDDKPKNLEALEKELGAESYKKLCVKTVEYVFDPLKLEAARTREKSPILDSVINKAMEKGTPTPSFYRPDSKKVSVDDE